METQKILKTPKTFGTKLKIILLICSITTLILICSISSLYLFNKKADKYIYKGVIVNNIDVGGLSKEEAKKKLEALNNSLKDRKLILSYEDKKVTLALSDLDSKYDLEKISQDAFEYDKNLNIFSKLASRTYLKNNPINIKEEFTYNKDRLNTFLESLSKSINREPENATIMRNNTGEFLVRRDRSGIKIKNEELKQATLAQIFSNNPSEIVIPVETTTAKIKYNDLILVKDLVSTYTTSLTNNYNRTENITIASKHLNQTLVMPGEVFSMNQALGTRTRAKGYLDAAIFVNNQVVPDLAGGICQLVSTTYNAALLTNLEIVERTPHSMAVAYVPPGQDATIAGDAIDFKFKNNKNYPLYIESYINNGQLTVNFYGQQEANGETVKIISRGSRSYAEVYKQIYKNGQLVSSTLISKDSYR
ncbi:exported protein [Clostridium polyendosporum]|uniref:Exported protein n=1 Tax=Clostridium polyendosporum TaxID=69208 RepID=A0A919RXV6_9CLOT|nr:VanW family protein [Clostridium polyendosporum]GIM28520.1 exported protein [Clostridium polyendosporum]